MPQSSSIDRVIIPALATASGLAVALCLGLMTSSARADGAAAHEIAERFAGETAGRSAADERMRQASEEAEMLERAREEAARRAAEEGAARQQDGERQRALEEEREAEARQLAEKLRRAEEARRLRAAESGAAIPEESPALVFPSVPARDEAPRQIAREGDAPPSHEKLRALDPRVTVLLLMEPGDRGIRRFNKTADPVLCVGSLCYVSRGADKPAREMSRSRALGSLNTLGRRADACNQRLACVFRAVELPAGTPLIQPVDLKVMVHDRRTPRLVSADRSCRLAGSSLVCGRIIQAPGYRAWVVPEVLADSVGPEILEHALRNGLTVPGPHEAALR